MTVAILARTPDLPDTLTPREIVSELDRYIVGQRNAKRAVAIALRNRWRRQQVPDELRDEIAPKNIIMIGPTGVGKTEIARRLAKLAQAPFIKVEASKFTEVGYVGRDVESMVRDLVEIAVKMVRDEEKREGAACARASTPRSACSSCCCRAREPAASTPMGSEPERKSPPTTRARARSCAACCARGKLDDRRSRSRPPTTASPMIEVLTPQGIEEMEFRPEGHARQLRAEDAPSARA